MPVGFAVKLKVGGVKGRKDSRMMPRVVHLNKWKVIMTDFNKGVCLPENAFKARNTFHWLLSLAPSTVPACDSVGVLHQVLYRHSLRHSCWLLSWLMLASFLVNTSPDVTDVGENTQLWAQTCGMQTDALFKSGFNVQVINAAVSPVMQTHKQ